MTIFDESGLVGTVNFLGRLVGWVLRLIFDLTIYTIYPWSSAEAGKEGKFKARGDPLCNLRGQIFPPLSCRRFRPRKTQALQQFILNDLVQYAVVTAMAMR